MSGILATISLQTYGIKKHHDINARTDELNISMPSTLMAHCLERKENKHTKKNIASSMTLKYDFVLGFFMM
jgi:hypothetical protein